MSQTVQLPLSRPAPVPRPQWPVTAARVACGQVSLALLVAGWGWRPYGLLAAGVAAAVLMALVAVRRHGRWGYQWLSAWLGFLVRRRGHTAPPDVSPAYALLGAVSPGARVESLRVGEHAFGIVVHAGGATAVFEPAPASTLVSSAPSPLPDLAELLPPYEPGGPQVTAQLLVRVVPALGTPHGPAVAVSYWQLTGNRVPAYAQAWLAVQVRRDPSHHGDDAVRAALANLCRRLIRQTPSLTPLGPDGILPLIGTLTQLPSHPPQRPYAATPGPDPRILTERWPAVRTGDTWHCLLRLRAWPDDRALVSTLAAVPAAATVVGIAACRRGGSVAAEVVVGVSMPTLTGAKAAAQALVTGCARRGATLTRLDGYQRHGLVRTLPLGGFPPC
jgi:type VII secretion protein EccE